MADKWVEPPQSRSAVSAAGRRLADGMGSPAQQSMDLELVNRWRSAHSFPLNLMQNHLRHQARKLGREATIAQRLKRLPSVTEKLRRFPSMKLARMHDIGGCRAVVLRFGSADKLLENLRASIDGGRTAIELRGDPYDYVRSPKPDGYRSIHQVVQYRSRSEHRRPFDGLHVEIQLRSRPQHRWATAVETVDAVRDFSLKSGVGPDAWREFFRLTSTAFAMREGLPIVPGTPTSLSEVLDRIRTLDEELRALRLLGGYVAAAQLVSERWRNVKSYVLLDFNVDEGKVRLRRFKLRDHELANEEYARVEQEAAGNPTRDVVLVATDSLDALRRAYPNYFGDARSFASTVRRMLSEAK